MAKTLWLLKWLTSPAKISLLIAELLLETQGSYVVWIFSRGSPCTTGPVWLVFWPLSLHRYALCKKIHEGDTIFSREILKREIQLNKRILFFPHLSVLQNATIKVQEKHVESRAISANTPSPPPHATAQYFLRTGTVWSVFICLFRKRMYKRKEGKKAGREGVEEERRPE